MLIGQLAAVAGVSAKTIRFYEQAGLMQAPARTRAGYRDYPPAALTRLGFIRQAQTAGFSLAEIRGILSIRDGGLAPCEHVTSLIAQHLAQVDERIAELTRTRAALAGLRRRAAVTSPAACPESDICSIFTSPEDR